MVLLVLTIVKVPLVSMSATQKRQAGQFVPCKDRKPTCSKLIFEAQYFLGKYFPEPVATRNTDLKGSRNRHKIRL